MTELSRLRGSEGYGACADEFRGGLWGFCRLYAGFPMPGVFGCGDRNSGRMRLTSLKRALIN